MRGIAALTLGLGLLHAAAVDAGGRRYGEVMFEPCSLTADSAPSPVEAQCGTVEVPENRADPTSRRIGLALAWIPANGAAEPDPVFMLAGGPGQAAREAYPMIAHAFRDVRRSRHVLLLDARGTGGSNPLACHDDEGRAALSEADDESLPAARAFAERCRDALSANADLRHYGTAEHVADLDAVRQALGAAQVNLVGISYGTRVAQQYAQTYPQAVRTLVLDSVVPNTLVLGSEHGRNLDAALEQQFERCNASPSCAAQLGNPREHLATVSARLKQGGLPPVRYRDASSHEWREEVPRFGHLALLLRLYAYTPLTASMLPWTLHEAAGQRFDALLAQARMVQNSATEAIYHGMQLSVTCTEDLPDLAAEASPSGSVIGSEFVDFLRAQCEVWPRGERSPRFREPLRGDWPVLLLSGEYDPVTPSRYGDEVAATLPRGRHLVLNGQGHNVLGAGCMPKLFAQFIERADAGQLAVACLGQLRPLPPFAGAYGWEP